MDWTNFYLVTAGAAATLLGLLFIAVQFQIDSFAGDPANRWHAIARSTYSLYVLLFIAPLLFLIPSFDAGVRGNVLIVVALVGIYRAVFTWFPVWREILHGRREGLWHTFWLLVGPLLAYVAIGGAGFAMRQGDPGAANQTTFAAALVGLFGIALRNSWNLLFDLSVEKKRGGRA